MRPPASISGRAGPALDAAEIAPVAGLVALPNLGPRSAQMLVGAGIVDIERLRALGAVAAYERVRRRQAGRGISLNLLWALEGALSGRPWQVVAREDRTRLLMAWEDLRAADADADAEGVRPADRAPGG